MMENPRKGKHIPGKLRLKKGSENSGTPLVRREIGVQRGTWRTIGENKQIAINKETPMDRQEMETQTDKEMEIKENFADSNEQGNEKLGWTWKFQL
ncbi:hypothetical protein JTB14_009955 [Gonioctena quinquepunctata]|nr:hypothetical protein JTB14_009955 [Gonioctena quinquepunctata]